MLEGRKDSPISPKSHLSFEPLSHLTVSPPAQAAPPSWAPIPTGQPLFLDSEVILPLPSINVVPGTVTAFCCTSSPNALLDVSLVLQLPVLLVTITLNCQSLKVLLHPRLLQIQSAGRSQKARMKVGHLQIKAEEQNGRPCKGPGITNAELVMIPSLAQSWTSCTSQEGSSLPRQDRASRLRSVLVIRERKT